MESESKWNNDVQQRWSKDDQKEQSHLHELERKFQTTDYSEKSGLSPSERLAAMNRDINAIVIEREHLAQEREKAESGGASAMSIQQSDAGRRADPSIGNDPSQSSVKSYASAKGGDASSSSVSSGPGQQASFPTGDIGKSSSESSSKSSSSSSSSSQSLGSSLMSKARRVLDMGRSGGDSSDASASQRSPIFGRDKLDDEPAFQRPLTRAQRSERDSGIQQASSSSSSVQQGGVQLGNIKLSPDDRNWESQIPIGDRSGIRLASSGSGLDKANGGPGSKDMDRARQGDDMARVKAERQRELAELGIGDYKSDPDNHPSEEDVGRLWANNVNATVPRGEIVRTKKSVSTAYSPTARAQEDADPSRTHTRTGRDRVMELGADDAKLSQKDFEQHMAGRSSPSGGSMQLAGDHDFMASAGGLFQKDNKLVLPRDSSSASSQSSHSHGLSGMISELKSKARSGGAEVEDKLEQVKDKFEDKYASARDGLEDALSETKEKLGQWKDRVVEKSEELGSKLKGKGEQVKDDAVDKTRDLKASAQSGMSKAKASAEGWVDRLEDGAERVVDKVKDEAEELVDKVKDGAQDVKEEALHLKDKAFHKLNEAVAHIKGVASSDVKQQPVRVDATPQYVHIERDNVDQNLSSREVDPIIVPDSLRGLGGGTPLPAPKLDLSLSKDASLTDAVSTKEGIYVPAGLRGLVDESDRQLPKADLSLPSINIGSSSSSSTLSSLSQAAAGARERMKQQGFYVPDSLRGLEDSEDLTKLRSRGADPWSTPSPSSPLSVPREALQELPHPNDNRGDIEIKHSSLKPKLDSIADSVQQSGEGIVSKITHALHLDRAASPRERSSSPQMPLFDRSPSTDAVSYSQSDLTGRGRSPSPRPRSASPALSDQLAAANARDRSPTGTPHSGLPHNGIQDWDIMHDDQFEELLAEQME